MVDWTLVLQTAGVALGVGIMVASIFEYMAVRIYQRLYSASFIYVLTEHREEIVTGIAQRISINFDEFIRENRDAVIAGLINGQT